MPIDKEKLYGRNNQSSDRDEALNGQIIRKALDLPNDMNTDIRTGLGWKELLVIGGLALGGGHLIATRMAPTPPPPPPAVAPADRDTTRSVTVEKYIP